MSKNAGIPRRILAPGEGKSARLLFPSVGIARGQSARINFTNVSDGELNLTFIAVDDNNVSHLRTVMTLEPGQTGHVDLNADLIGLLEADSRYAQPLTLSWAPTGLVAAAVRADLQSARSKSLITKRGKLRY
jgi:hypothetical protein